MISKFKTEILIATLLLVTLAVILANKVVVRSCSLLPQNAAKVMSGDDRAWGGTSVSSAEIDDDLFRFTYDVNGKSLEKIYSLISISPGEDFPRDLSWVDRFEITCKTTRQGGEQVFFYIKDFEPTISIEGDYASLKYNETLLSLSDKMETVTVRPKDFLVPTWWQQSYNAKGKAAEVAFKNVTLFEFNVNTGGEGVIEIASIQCVGNWVDSATLNQSLLWLWMGGTLIGLVVRTLRLKKRLQDKTVSASQLQAHNNLLITESATYHELARRDPLTGLFNRYGLEAEFADLSSKSSFEYSMLLFDLDKFKEINDNLGHCYGDRVLFDVATIVRSKLGDKDIIARWGGDEFLVILSNRSAKQASDFAEEIRQSILASDLIYSCSFGVCKSEADSNFESIFSKADAALYDSKNSGRNKISSYRKESGRRAADRHTAAVPEITLLPNDLPTGEFTIYE